MTRAVVGSAVGLTVFLAAPGAVRAAPAPDPVLVEGNVRPGDCAGAGLTGAQLFGADPAGDASDVEGSGDVSGDGLFLTVTINAGWVASGIVVKGGPDTYVYSGPFVGPTTVDDTRAPDNEGGNQAQISHWFVCGGPGGGPTPSPGPSETATPSPEPGVSETSSPRPVLMGQRPQDELPVTGVRMRDLAAFGALMVLAGFALTLATRRRRFAR